MERVRKGLFKHNEKDAEMEALLSEITSGISKMANELLQAQLVPYLRAAGIKGEITKGKIKWRGVKLKVKCNGMREEYQLCQRGVDISPIIAFDLLPTKRHDL